MRAYDAQRAYRLIADQLDSAANVVSGLELRDIGKDGHAIANELWRVAAHLRNRARQKVSPDVIRVWARLNGHHIRDSGRIPLIVEQEYYDAVLDLPPE